MECYSILTYFSIPIYLLNGFVSSTNDSGFGAISFEDHDNYWPINPQHSQIDLDEDYSELFNTHNSHESIQPEPAMTSDIELPSTMDDIENTFLKLNRFKPLVWQILIDNNTEVLQRICFAAWPDYIPNKRCKSDARPYSTARLHVEYPTKSYPLAVNTLRCKCYPDNMKREYKTKINALYLAKHDESSVFLLRNTGGPKSHKLRLFGMIPLNLHDIISTVSFTMPVNRTSSPLTWNLTQTEKEFYIIYNNFSDNVKWQAIRDKNNSALKIICMAAWEEGSNKKCYAKPTSNKDDPTRNGLKAKLVDNYHAVTVRADFLQCRCTSNDLLTISQIRDEIDPIYFAKYNSTTVFQLILDGEHTSHNLKVVGKKTLLNMTI